MNRHPKLIFLISLNVLVAVFLNQLAQASSHILSEGASPGNHILMNEDFDFRLKKPELWLREPHKKLTTNSGSAPSEVWVLSNSTVVADPAQQSWVRVEFQSDIELPTKSNQKRNPADQLCRYLNLEQSDWAPWLPFDSINVSGCYAEDRTDPGDSKAKLGKQYYLITDRMVVALSSRKHPTAHGSTDVRSIIDSVDRRSAKPTLKAISFSPSDTVQVNEQLCIFIEMDHIHSSFTTASLKRLGVKGLPKHWSPFKVKWSQRDARFEACYKVTAGFLSSADLLVNALEVENEREMSLSCWEELLNVRCNGNDISYVVPQSPPKLINNTPSTKPPVITDIQLSHSSKPMRLTLTFESPLKISHGIVKLRSLPSEILNQFVIAPWQINGASASIDLLGAPNDGTIVIQQATLVDEQGRSTTMSDCKTTPPERHCKPQPHYSKCDWNEVCADTNLPVIEVFLNRNR